MVRRYKRTYRRSRVLTKANIYANKGAKSQSKQIAALSRKVNYLNKINKPEIRTIYRNIERQFTNSALASNFAVDSLSVWSQTYSGDDDLYNQQLSGNFNRTKGISFNFVAEYTNDFTGDESDNQLSASYRVVILQSKVSQPISESGIDEPQIVDIFNTTSSTTSSDTNTMMPLVQGITSQYKVLYSKSFTIHKFRPIQQHKIYIPARKCLNFYRSKGITDSSDSGKGRVWVAFLTGGLHYDTTHTSRINISGSLKIAFTDN